MLAANTPETSPRGIVRASALPPLALQPEPPRPRVRPAVVTPPRTAGKDGRLRLFAALRSRSMRVFAFDAAVLGALLSFVTELLALGPALIDGGRAMLLAALVLTACWVVVLGADLRRLLTLLRRWR